MVNRIPWASLEKGEAIKEVYDQDGLLINTWKENNMDRNERIEIRPTQNGYIVEYSYRQAKLEGDFDYRYMDEKYIFADWDGVIKYVTDKKLNVPAAQ